MLNLLSATIYFPTGSGLGAIILGILRGMYNLVGNYAVAVILFTLVLRLIMFPLDFGTKFFTKRNANRMAELKPEMDAIKKRFPNDMMMKSRAQQALMRSKGYGQGGFMLFTLANLVVMLVVFITVFGCLNQMSNYNLNKQFEELQTIHAKYDGEVLTDNAEYIAEITQAYADTTVSFLWVKNIFRPDTWDSQTLSWKQFRDTVGGGGVFAKSNYMKPPYLVAVNPDKPTSAETKAAREAYEAELKITYEEIYAPIKQKHTGWNGMLLLVALAGITMYLSAVINAKTMKTRAESNKIEPVVQYSMRGTKSASPTTGASSSTDMVNPAMMGGMMKIVMPLMMVVITLMWNAALALYITAGAIFAIGLTFVSNYFSDKLLAKEKKPAPDTPVINPHAKYFKK